MLRMQPLGMLIHFEYSPSCVKISREFAAEKQLKGCETKLLAAHEEKTAGKTGDKEKKRQLRQEDKRAGNKRAKKEWELAEKGTVQLEDMQQFWQELNKAQPEAFRVRFPCLRQSKRLFMLASKSNK